MKEPGIRLSGGHIILRIPDSHGDLLYAEERIRTFAGTKPQEP